MGKIVERKKRAGFALVSGNLQSLLSCKLLVAGTVIPDETQWVA